MRTRILAVCYFVVSEMISERSTRVPMHSPQALTALGKLPIRKGPARFAVGDPNGLSSNSWRVWAEKKNDVYIKCRDSFSETKVSLHTSGRWRMGFTTEAVAKRPTLIAADVNRAWEVWDKPPEVLPNTTTAFHLYFPTPELAVLPEQRVGKAWKDVIFIEAAPPGKITIITLFLTSGDFDLRHESEPSFVLASFALGADRYAKLVAHGDLEGNISEFIASGVEAARVMATERQIDIPPTAFGYFFGHRDNGARFIVGARIPKRGDLG
jgi:hypothetical protein